MVGGCEKRELTDDQEKTCGLSVQFANFARSQYCDKKQRPCLHFDYLEGHESNRANSYLSVQFANLLLMELICVFIGC